jgi:hypothetical protein
MKTIILLILILPSLNLIAQENIYANNVIPKDNIGVNNRNFKLEGFYYSKRLDMKSGNHSAKYIAPMIFYKDGTVMNFDYFGNSSHTIRLKEKGKKCILKPKKDYSIIIDFFKCYAEIVNKKETNSVYSIDGSIIRIQHLGANFFVEQRGIVLNDSTFIITKRINYKTNQLVSENFKYQFQPSKKPDSTKLNPNSQIKNYFQQ